MRKERPKPVTNKAVDTLKPAIPHLKKTSATFTHFRITSGNRTMPQD